jgi:S1-C subfamily serine protease
VNLLDLLLIGLLAFGLVAGWRSGFFGPALALAGGLAGFAGAMLLATLLRSQLAAVAQPGRALVTILGLGFLVLAGEAFGAAIGATMSRSLQTSWSRRLDAAGGAVVGLAHVVLLTWVLGGLLAAGLTPALAPLARGSAVLGIVYDRLSGTDLPQLFAGLEPPPAAPVDLPAASDAQALAQSAVASTAQVAGTGCGAYLKVGSGFFITPDHLVTNAHVVAGTDATTVTLGGVTHTATVVLFDPQADVAVLYAPGTFAPALVLATEAPQRGVTGVTLGYPGGGNLTLSPAAVTALHQVDGPDIYGDGSYPHSIVEIRADVRRGDSGGPLVIAPGTVGGMVFGESRTIADVGYAIAAPAVTAAIGDGAALRQAVDTGPCG